ncbi:MAG: endonuclease/exonuclease/phosphatase family protein [Actinomycetaceae bacterium]|nr:endonuclease/exonuclease/phosphatase family protein [Actinomycetaceae bacterium]
MAQGSQSQQTLRIISANIQHGKPAALSEKTPRGLIKHMRSWLKHRRQYRQALEETGRLFDSLDADIVCLQEVDTRTLRVFLSDQTEIVARAMKRRYTCRGLFYHSLSHAIRLRPWYALYPTPPIIGGYGVSIISRYPVAAWQWLPLGAAPVRFIPTGGKGFAGTRTKIALGQTRGMISAAVMIGNQILRIGSTHLELHKPTALHQLRHCVNQMEDTADIAWILCGDMNLEADDISQLLRTNVVDRGGYGGNMSQNAYWDVTELTIPAHAPRRTLDHVIAPHNMVPLNVQTVRMPVSDHRALVVDMEVSTSAS